MSELRSSVFAVEIEFITEALGTAPADPKIYSRYIAENAPEATKEDELADQEDSALCDPAEDKGFTIFLKDDEMRPYIPAYHFKGFFKSALQATMENKAVKKIPRYKGRVDQFVMIEPRKIVVQIPEGAEMTELERPLRAETPKGPRVCLARSEQLPVGTTATFRIRLFANAHITEKTLRTCCEYGEFHGYGQWRNAGFGQFIVKSFTHIGGLSEETKEEEMQRGGEDEWCLV